MSLMNLAVTPNRPSSHGTHHVPDDLEPNDHDVDNFNTKLLTYIRCSQRAAGRGNPH